MAEWLGTRLNIHRSKVLSPVLTGPPADVVLNTSVSSFSATLVNNQLGF